jgi:hypothetical protein
MDHEYTGSRAKYFGESPPAAAECPYRPVGSPYRTSLWVWLFSAVKNGFKPGSSIDWARMPIGCLKKQARRYTERLQKGARKTIAASQKDYRTRPERLENQARKTTELSQEDYRTKPERL